MIFWSILLIATIETYRKGTLADFSKSKWFPCCSSTALRQLNPVHKKGPWSIFITLSTVIVKPYLRMTGFIFLCFTQCDFFVTIVRNINKIIKGKQELYIKGVSQANIMGPIRCFCSKRAHFIIRNHFVALRDISYFSAGKDWNRQQREQLLLNESFHTEMSCFGPTNSVGNR